MSTTSSFSFTNTTAGGTVSTTAIAVGSNYGKVLDSAEEVRVNNKTCALDQSEMISYRCRDLNTVNGLVKPVYPARVTNGIEFGVRVDELLRTVDANGIALCDEPIVATLSFKTPKSSHITDAVVTQVFERLLGACYDQTGKKYIWNDLMRSVLDPT